MNKQMKWLIIALAVIAAGAALIVMTGCSSDKSSKIAARFGVPSVQAAEAIGHIGTGKGAEAVEKAGNADKYVFALFYRENNDQLTKARSLIESARKKVTRKSEIVEINMADQSEQDIINKYGVSRAPMPLILELAPNGAIMGGFPAAQLPDETRLVESVGCKASEQALKALQQKNMVVVCAQSSSTAENARAMRGVEEFLRDPQFGKNTAVVMADPSDPAAAKFMSQLGLDPKSPIANTVLLAPPGSVISTFQGETHADKFVAAVKAAAAPKAGGCCPPGSGKSCGPTGK
jgi:hypothetical protein